MNEKEENERRSRRQSMAEGGENTNSAKKE
jgi:hypothetical protein